MANFTITDSKWVNTLTLNKLTGSLLTISTTGLYVDKNIALTLNARSATISLAAPASASLSSVSYTYNTTNTNFVVSGSAAISGTSTLTVSLSGWIGSTTSTNITGTASLSTTVARIGIGATLSGTGAKKPTISRTTTTATGATNIGEAAATTTAPGSGFFISVLSAANTATVTATPKVTSNGYGTTSYYGATNATATNGAAASDITYIPIKTGAVSVPNTTITANPSINNTPSSNLYTISVSKTQSVTPSITNGWVTSAQGTAGTMTVNGSMTLNLSKIGTSAVDTATYNPSTSNLTITITAGYYHSDRTITINKMNTTSVTQGTSTKSGTAVTRATAYWGTGYITSGTMNAATFANTATTSITYLDISDSTQAPILVSGDYLYINKGYTDNLKISLAKLVPDGSDVKGHANYLLSGHSAYDNDGTLVAGTIPTNTASGITFNGLTATVAAGYYAANTSKEMTLALIQSGTTTISSLSFGYDSTNTRFNVTGTGTISAPTVSTAGFISSTTGTRTTNTASVSTTVPRIYLGTTKSNGSLTVAPTLVRTAKPANDTWIDGASGAATTTKPNSGVYVLIDANAATNVLKIKSKVTTAGYGTINYFGTSEDSYTVGAATATTRYIPINLGSVTSTAGTATATGGSASVSITGVSTTSTNTGYSISASATGGSASTTTSTLTITAGYITAALTATVAGKSATGASSSTAVYIAKGALQASIQTTTAGSAGMSASGFTALTGSNTSSYYVNLTTTAGSVIPKASVKTEGYVKTETATATASTVSVNGNGTKLYIPTNTITGSVVDLTAPSVAVSGTVTGMSTTSTATSYYITVNGTGTNGSVKGKATAGTTTGIVPASASNTSAATTITPGITGSGTKIYIPAASITSTAAISTTPTVTISGTTNMTTATTGTYYFTRTGSASAGTILSKYQVTGAGYTPVKTATNGGTLSVTPSKTADATIYIPTASLTVTKSSGAGACSYTSASSANVTVSDSDTSGVKVVFTGSGTVTALANVTGAGYRPVANNVASGSNLASGNATATKYITGVKITPGKTFSIQVPNGNTTDYITFVFTVDASGNVTVAGPD